MKKTKGFTTMELSIVMLMAGLISSLAYGGYSLFVKQFHAHSRNTTAAMDLQVGIFLLKKDLDQSSLVYASGTELECMHAKFPVTWSFDHDQYLVRTQAARTDTFYLELREFHFAFGGQPLPAQRSVTDEVSFTAEYKKMEVKPVFKKNYSNKTLMELAEQNGH